MPTKRILRSRQDRIVAGVAGGLAGYLNIDPLFVRLGFVVLGLFQGLGLLLYALLWLLIPNEDSLTTETRDQVRENVNEMRSTVERAFDRVRNTLNP